MKNAMIGLLAETGLHPGSERSTGVIDLPVAREAGNGYPVIVGSSLKGALKDLARQREVAGKTKRENITKIFGESDNAGVLAFTDARLLLLPVRSLSEHFKWVTCPYLLERLQRDSKLAGIAKEFMVPLVNNGEAVTTENQKETLFLEEMSFETRKAEDDLNSVVKAISLLIMHETVQQRLQKQLVIVSDDDFKYFTSYGLQINARNMLNEKTKISENLWYEEMIPSDSLFYALLILRPGQEDELEKIKALFEERPYLQVGGNETIGQGWCAVKWLQEEAK